jgi:hypothetical protein
MSVFGTIFSDNQEVPPRSVLKLGQVRVNSGGLDRFGRDGL